MAHLLWQNSTEALFSRRTFCLKEGDDKILRRRGGRMGVKQHALSGGVDSAADEGYSVQLCSYLGCVLLLPNCSIWKDKEVLCGCTCVPSKTEVDEGKTLGNKGRARRTCDLPLLDKLAGTRTFM